MENSKDKLIEALQTNITNLLTTVDYWVDRCEDLAKGKQKDYLLGLIAGIAHGIAITKLIEWAIN
jgi:hypothetical protein